MLSFSHFGFFHLYIIPAIKLKGGWAFFTVTRSLLGGLRVVSRLGGLRVVSRLGGLRVICRLGGLRVVSRLGGLGVVRVDGVHFRKLIAVKRAGVVLGFCHTHSVN